MSKVFRLARKNTRTIIVESNHLEDVIKYAYHSNPITTEVQDLLYMVDGTYYYAIIVMLIQEVINDNSYSQLLELLIQQTEQKFI